VDLSSFNVLSLCSGAGGLDLGLRLAVSNARTVCYVENEAYACEVLASRMQDKTLDDAPVWTDLRTFNGKPWRGTVDCLIGGYPCQPFSVAGRQRGINDRRHLWPDIARLIREIEPGWCFFENVANHLNIGYREVRRELEEMGYRVAEGLFTAAEVGAPHKRQRLFILAHSRRQLRRSFRPASRTQESVSDLYHQRSGSGSLAYTQKRSQRKPEHETGSQPWGVARSHAGRRCSDLANADFPRLEGRGLSGCQRANEWLTGKSGRPLFPPGPADGDGWRDFLEIYPEAEPGVCDPLDGLTAGLGRRRPSNRIDELRLLGNGVVSACAALAFGHLAVRLGLAEIRTDGSLSLL
jgi:DNA (cytosine-5)-methyltransferase 1